MAGSVIVAGARTPMGRLLGSLKDFSGADLGGVAIKAALERAGVAPDQVQYVIMGQVLLAGAGQIPARQAAHKAGIPLDVPSITINKVCLSGLDAIALADQLIRAGEFDIIVAGGQESMTNAPHLLPKSRSGYKYGSVEMLDAMAYDGLTDIFEHIPMGESTDNVNKKLRLTREEQDEFAARSHQRAAIAQKNGVFDDEITPVSIPQRKGEPIEFREDEGIRGDTTVEGLAKLRPAFTKDGTITAGTSSQISDGACAVVVMSKAKAEELGLGLAGRDRRARQRRGPGQFAALTAVERDPGRPAQGGPVRRRPRPDRDQRGVRRGRDPVDKGPRRRPRTRSTSTAARSRSGTRSACPAHGWRSPLPTSSGGAAAAPAPPRCAAAAARATR